MAQPKIPQLSEIDETLLYQKLTLYNQGRASYKEEGAYLVVLPRSGHPLYTLWVYSPLTERRTIFYLCDLSPGIHESMRTASTLCYYSKRPLYLMEYNAKRMQTRGDDLIFFGKYHGHYLHEILRIDPDYLGWIAYKFEPRIPKQVRFISIARIYHSVYLDVQRRKTSQPTHSRYLGQEGDKITNLTLTVLQVKLEDNPYKTRYYRGQAVFYVRQLLHLQDAIGNLVTLRLQAKTGSWTSCQLPASEHAFQPGEIIRITSARIAHTYTIRNIPVTRLSHVKLNLGLKP